MYNIYLFLIYNSIINNAYFYLIYTFLFKCLYLYSLYDHVKNKNNSH